MQKIYVLERFWLGKVTRVGSTLGTHKSPRESKQKIQINPRTRKLTRGSTQKTTGFIEFLRFWQSGSQTKFSVADFLRKKHPKNIN